MTSAGPRPGLVLAVVFIVTVTMSLSSNVLNIAVPALTAQFAAPAALSTAMVLSFQLVNTVLLIPAGQLADGLDRRTVFLSAVAVFAVVSLLLGFSPNALTVVIGRAVQGAAAAMLLSNAVALLAAVHPRQALTRAMGGYLAGFSLGQVGGPLLGGLLVTTVGWQWLFWVTAPPMAFALGWGLLVLRRVPSRPRSGVHVDVPGGLLLAVFLGGSQLVLAFSAGVGMDDPRVLAGLAASLAVLPLLVAVERRVPRPVLAASLFRVPTFRWGLVQGGLVMVPRFGAMTIAGLYFQGVGGDSAAQAAVKVVSFAVGMTVGSLAAGWLSAVAGDRGSLLGSAVVATAGMAVLWAGVGPGMDRWVITGLLVLGLGSGAFAGVNATQTMSGTPPDTMGVVNAIRVMVQAYTSGLGLALAMTAVVAFAPAGLAADFMAGDTAALTGGVHLIDSGFRLAYGTFTVLMSAGVLACLRGVPVPPYRRII